MRHFKMSPLHLPAVHKVKVRKVHYRACLAVTSVLILVFHFYLPEYEPHMALAVNLLFAVDPTA